MHTTTKNPTNKAIIMHSKDTYRCNIPTSEAIGAMKDLTSNAYKLLIYYYCRNSGWVFNEESIAKDLNVTVRKFRELRKELVDKKYLLYTNSTPPVYFIGKKAVFDWEHPEE